MTTTAERERVVLGAGEVSRRRTVEGQGFRVSYTTRSQGGKVMVVLVRRA